MDAFLHSGRAVDVVLAFVALEALALLWLVRRRPGLGPLDVVGQLAAGAFLLGAVRCALTGADARWTAGCLLAALPAHLFDLVRRWRGATPSSPPSSDRRPRG
ncbi:MAG TPA: hypothetical protein VLQ79_11140 [Myxococcaceae bacterium]|nr:hypothetical protein [Myxococcaceae bacterium]